MISGRAVVTMSPDPRHAVHPVALSDRELSQIPRLDSRAVSRCFPLQRGPDFAKIDPETGFALYVLLFRLASLAVRGAEVLLNPYQ